MCLTPFIHLRPPYPLFVDIRVVFGIQIPALNCIFDILSSHPFTPNENSTSLTKLMVRIALRVGPRGWNAVVYGDVVEHTSGRSDVSFGARRYTDIEVHM